MSDKQMKPWEVMKAYEEGAQIEVRLKGADQWFHCLKPVWNHEKSDYRVKPTPKPPRIEPFTFETFPRGAWVRVPSVGTDYSPSYISTSGVRLSMAESSFEWLRDNAKLLVIENGKVVAEKPCGVEVRDE